MRYDLADREVRYDSVWRGGRNAWARLASSATTVLLACAAVAALSVHSSREDALTIKGDSLQGRGTKSWRESAAKVAAISRALSLSPPSATRIQRLVAQDIPSSGNSSVEPMQDPPNLCTIRGSVVSVSPRKWFCANPAHRTDTCATCHSGSCLSPEAALLNMAEANASEAFVGWNPQGGGPGNQDQSVTIKLPGSGEAVRAILWANSGLPEHDPAWIKVWASHDGEYFQLRDIIDVRHLQGNSDLTVLPLAGHRRNASAELLGNLDSRSQTRAKYWRVNPGPGAPTGPEGIQLQSIPRSIGLCPTVACTNCGAGNTFFNWAAEQGESTYARWLARQPTRAGSHANEQVT